MEVVLYSIVKINRMSALVYIPEIRFKIAQVVLPFPTMQGLLEDGMYVSSGDIPVSVGCVVYWWSCAWYLRLTHGLINQ